MDDLAHVEAGRLGEVETLAPDVTAARRAFAVHITGFQMHMSTMLMGFIFSGCLERWPNMKVVIGEAGLGKTRIDAGPLERAFASVFSQDYPAFEVLITAAEESSAAIGIASRTLNDHTPPAGRASRGRPHLPDISPFGA